MSVHSCGRRSDSLVYNIRCLPLYLPKIILLPKVQMPQRSPCSKNIYDQPGSILKGNGTDRKPNSCQLTSSLLLFSIALSLDISCTKTTSVTANVMELEQA